MQATLSLAAPKEAEGNIPGDLAMWCFICAELLVFGIFFVLYAFVRARNVALFNASQLQLDRTSGLINTLLLITSSYLVVRAVEAIRRNQGRVCAAWLAGAMV